jgi:hypothetical protein
LERNPIQRPSALQAAGERSSLAKPGREVPLMIARARPPIGDRQREARTSSVTGAAVVDRARGRRGRFVMRQAIQVSIGQWLARGYIGQWLAREFSFMLWLPGSRSRDPTGPVWRKRIRNSVAHQHPLTSGTITTKCSPRRLPGLLKQLSGTKYHAAACSCPPLVYTSLNIYYQILVIYTRSARDAHSTPHTDKLAPHSRPMPRLEQNGTLRGAARALPAAN